MVCFCVCVCACELNSCSVQVLYSLLATRHSNTHTCANLSVGQPQSQSNGNLGSSYSALHMQCTLCTHTISCYVRSSRSTPAKYVHVDASTGVGVCCALHNVPKSETIAGCTYIPMWIVDMLWWALCSMHSDYSSDATGFVGLPLIGGMILPWPGSLHMCTLSSLLNWFGHSYNIHFMLSDADSGTWIIFCIYIAFKLNIIMFQHSSSMTLCIETG